MSRLIRTIGLGAGCILLPILTCAQPDPAALLYWQPFDAGPGLPTAWSVSSTGTQASAQAESPGSGHLNVLFEGDTAGWLVSPTLDFREAQLDSLHLLVRRSSTFAADGFRIVASVDNGATFSIPLAGSDWLPERANSWTPKTLAIQSTVAGHQVRIAISTDGQSAGVLRIDDFQLTGTGHIPSTTFGFAATQDSLAAGGLPWKIQTRLKNDSAHPATALSFDLAGAEPMQLEASSPDGGWQFDVAWVDDRWQIVATSNRGIEPAEELQIDLLLTPTGPSDHVYELEVGRILVAGGADGNQDLDAVPGLSATTLLIEEGTASIALDPEYVAFGYVRSGAPVERTFRVFNPSGTAPLMVELAPSHEAVSVSKSEFAVAPGSAELVSVGLNPAPLPLGAFMEEIKAEHTAPGEALTIPVLGSVIAHPLGDADESGGFDTVDLVRMIDYVLGVLTASETAFPSVDLFPFGRPDSQIDVRDLSVLARALVNQHWPDDS
ncbi:MAG: choice-of-anchor J domain-containing protein, partial [Bacteroidota bacterium]